MDIEFTYNDGGTRPLKEERAIFVSLGGERLYDDDLIEAIRIAIESVVKVRVRAERVLPDDSP